MSGDSDVEECYGKDGMEVLVNRTLLGIRGGGCPYHSVLVCRRDGSGSINSSSCNGISSSSSNRPCSSRNSRKNNSSINDKGNHIVYLH